MNKPSVYHFETSVAFLNSFIDYLSTQSKSFSLKSFADQCHFKYVRLKDILKNRVAMKLAYASHFQDALGLNEEEMFYFQVLIKKDLAKSEAEEKMYRLLMTTLNDSGPQDLSYQNNESLYQNHLCMTILSMLKLDGVGLSLSDIEQRLIYKDSEEDIKQAIENLIKHQLIEVIEGKIRRTFDSVRTENDTKVGSVHRYYKDVNELAIKAIHEEASKREFQCFSFCLNHEDIGLMKSLLRETRNRLSHLEKDKADYVYQVNLQAFPIAKSSEVATSASPLQ